MRTLWKPSKYDNGLTDVEETPKSWNVFDNAGRVLSETAVKGCVKKCNKIQTVGIVTQLKEAWKYRKIPKISPSKYKPPKPVAQKPSVKSSLQI